MRVEPTGPVPCELALFGDVPNWEEQQHGQPFVGRAGQQWWADVRRVTGLTRDRFYVSNLVKTGTEKKRELKPADVAAALPEFLDEIASVRPRVIVTAGRFVTRAVLGDVRLNESHGIPHAANIAGFRTVCIPTYHPSAGLGNKGFLAVSSYDLDRIGAFLRGERGVWAPSGLPWRSAWLSDEPGALPKAFRGVVAVDTEGWADVPWGLSFSYDGENAWVIRSTERDSLLRLNIWLQGRTVVMHNGLHDIPVLRAMGIHIGAYHDTQVLAYHHMLRTGSGVLESESQNLGTLAYRECGMCLGELADIPGVDFDTHTIPYTDEVLAYAGDDAIATYRLFQVYRKAGVPDTQPYQIDMGQIPLVEAMITHGIPFDADATTAFYGDVLDKLDDANTELRRMAARFGNRDFNPGSHPQVRDIITRKIGLRIRKRTKGGLASTNEKALADHQDHPFVLTLQRRRELDKLRGTYLVPLLDELL